MKLGPSGFGGESIRYQPIVGWRKTGTPCDPRASIAVLRGLGDWSRRSRITPSPGASLHPARSSRRCVRLFAESVHPSDYVGETFGIPFANQADFPSVLHPEGLRSRCPARLVRPLARPYLCRSGNTRDKDLKKHGDLDCSFMSSTSVRDAGTSTRGRSPRRAELLSSLGEEFLLIGGRVPGTPYSIIDTWCHRVQHGVPGTWAAEDFDGRFEAVGFGEGIE